MDVQHLFVAGNATADAELLKSKQGKDFAKFSIACNRYMGKELGSEVTYFECVVFSKQVEAVVEKVKKGDKVMVHGRPEASAYTSTKDGEVKAKLSIIVEDWQVLK